MSTALCSDSIPLSPSLSARLGRSAAQLLQQLHYWLVRSKHVFEGDRWIYNPYSAWADQLQLSQGTINRAIQRLRQLNLIRVERRNQSEWNQVNWYTIDYQELEPLISQSGSFRSDRDDRNDPLDQINLIPSYTETTHPTINSNSPTPHPVKNLDQGSNPLPTGHVARLLEKLARVLAPAPVSSQLAKLISYYTVDRVEAAIAVVEQHQRKGTTTNPPGLFRTALVGGWSPRVNFEEEDPTVSEEFDEWYKSAHSLGVVRASMMFGDELRVLTASEQWESWESISAAFPLARLQQMQQEVAAISKPPEVNTQIAPSSDLETLQQGDSVEVRLEDKWYPATYSKPDPKMRFSRITMALEISHWVKLDGRSLLVLEPDLRRKD